VEYPVSKSGKQSNVVLGLIRRGFKYIDCESFITLFNTYVRPHLEFCIQAWSPYYKKDIICLEKVQRRATKLIQGMKQLSYEERMHKLGLFSLEKRRLRGDLIEAFKILNGFENIDEMQFFERAITQHLRGNSQKLYKQTATRTCRATFFSQRVIEGWNKLPDEVITAPSVQAFKDRLDKYWELG
jgi:ribonuclease P/MRP protein subunit RPP40